MRSQSKGNAMRYLTLVPLLAVVIVMASSCGGGSSRAPASPTPKTLSSINISSGNNQTAAVGTELPNPLIATILDNQGKPLAGQTVNFKVTTGSGTVFAGAATSDSTGTIRERWTLGTVAGDQTLEVRAIDSNGAALVYATFHATAVAGTPMNIKVTPQITTPTQLLPVPVIITISDTYGNPNIGLAVSLTADSGGVVAPTEFKTNSSGQISAVWTVGAAIGVQTFKVTATGANPSQISLDVIRAPASAPTSILKASGDLQSVVQHLAAPIPFSVLVTDKLHNPVPNVEVIFSSTTENTPKAVTMVTDMNGLANLDGYFHSAGQLKLNASVEGIGIVAFDVNVIASSHNFDGEYECDMAPGIFVTNGTVAKYPPDASAQIYGHLRDISFDEATGAISFNQTISLGKSQSFTGVASIDSTKNAVINGTSILLKEAGSSAGDDWTCVRQ